MFRLVRVQHSPLLISPALVIPFLLLLLGIAVLPLSFPHFWESNRNKGIVTLVLSLPIAYWLAREAPHALKHSAIEYVSFLCLLGALFVIAGGIHVTGDLRATPRMNVLLMGMGAVLSNIIGTTGASMVMIRLLLRTNSERKHTSHIPLFFILLVSNSGGLLTPIGDPPLFLGYLRGVPFFWTMRLLPIWLVAVGYLLILLYWVDRRAYAAESKRDIVADIQHIEPVSVTGWLNVGLLFGVVGAVFLPTPYREGVMALLGGASLVLGSKAARTKNEFSFGPIVEVAVLFAGIFVTMVPALELLRQHGASLGITQPWHYFLTTGALSSVLDNAPTYLTFLSAAQGLNSTPEIVGVSHAHLVAISAGAVLMGANTYIGNGPNFMVKAIAESQGYRTDSFVVYAVKAIAILLPIYLVVTSYLLLA